MTFGQKLKTLRTDREITQLQLSQILGTSKSNISKYESDTIEPNFRTLCQIADFFDVSTDFLLNVEAKDPSYSFLFKIARSIHENNPKLDEAISEFCKKMNFDIKEFNNWIMNMSSDDYTKYVPVVASIFNCDEKYFYQNDTIPSDHLKLNNTETLLLNSYRNLTENQKYIILGKTLELEENNNNNSISSVAAEVPQKIGTDNPGK